MSLILNSTYRLVDGVWYGRLWISLIALCCAINTGISNAFESVAQIEQQLFMWQRKNELYRRCAHLWLTRYLNLYSMAMALSSLAQLLYVVSK